MHTYTITYTHMHTCTYTCTRVCTHSHIHTLSHTHIYTLYLLHTHIHTLSFTHTHTHSIFYTHTLYLLYTHICSIFYTHTIFYTQTHTLFYTHTLSFTHTHTHSIFYTHTAMEGQGECCASLDDKSRHHLSDFTSPFSIMLWATRCSWHICQVLSMNWPWGGHSFYHHGVCHLMREVVVNQTSANTNSWHGQCCIQSPAAAACSMSKAARHEQ